MRPIARFVVLLSFLVVSISAQTLAVSTEFFDSSVLRVCADPNNLPFSDSHEQGFENKIAAFFAKKLGRKLEYTWYPQSVGFAKNTLLSGKCDLVVGVAVPSGIMQNSIPYYHSSYVMIYKNDSKFKPLSMHDKMSADIRIGVIERSPGVDILVKHDLMDHMRSYPLVVDTNYVSPGRDMIKDVIENKIDIGILWGPIAGYLAKAYPGKFALVPLDSKAENAKLDFQIGMGMRFNEPTFKKEINDLIKNNQKEIDNVLKSYGVPLI